MSRKKKKRFTSPVSQLKHLLLAGFFLGASLHGEVRASSIVVSNPFTSSDLNGISPFYDWKTLESEHFLISFPKEFSEIAQHVANLYEEAHQEYSSLFRWDTLQKTLVVLLDNRDVANGLTSPLGRYGMVLWLTPPDSWQNINFNDEWLRMLVFHEYAHFMNMDTTRGLYRTARSVILDLSLPNVLWPPWMLEGLAVYMETQFTRGGRGRSSDYEMLLRTAVAEKVFDSRSFMSLDLINGNNPYYPMGDTRYQFGYHLMNQVSKQKSPDGVPLGKEALGRLSWQSANDVPFFLNDTLFQVVHKDWYQIWDEWVTETTARMEKDISKIKSQPLTPVQLLIEASREKSNQVSGIALSPDGKWLAYTLLSADQRSGLYLMDLDHQSSRRISDKFYGVGMSFTHDSKSLIYSEYNDLDQFTGYSDLKLYDLVTDSIFSLSERLRAKDPDVSADGTRVVFTQTELSRVSLAWAPMTKDAQGRVQLGAVEKLRTPPLYERISNPKFSRDGKKIFYSVHPNGKFQEDLMEFDLETRIERSLRADGSFNRFPAIDSSGALYFVSNATGVDNLYLYRGNEQPPQMVTNVLGGVRFPAFFGEKVYFSYFTTSGWSMARAEIGQKSDLADLDPERAKVSLPSIQSEVQKPHLSERQYPVQNYSAWPTLLPRGIIPLASVDRRGVELGAQTSGFDVLNLHRYVLGATYSTQIQSGNFYGLYSNRTTGADYTFAVSSLNTITESSNSVTDFTRLISVSAGMAYPWVRTYSQWTPSFTVNLQRGYDYRLVEGSPARLREMSATAFSSDLALSYSNQETSNLAVFSEGGRSTQIAVRQYLLSDGPLFKVFFRDQEFIRLAQHTILSPSLAGEWVSGLSLNAPLAKAVFRGRSSQSTSNSVFGDGLGWLGIRGYPNQIFLGRGAIKPALDFRIPISRVFRGWGTQRFFFENLYAVAFAEAPYWWPLEGAPVLLPAVGAGLRLSTEIFYVPVTWGAEYHYGFNRKWGTSDFFLNVLVSGPSF